MLRILSRVAGVALFATLSLATSNAFAQLTTGSIEGRVVAEDTGKALPGVTVTVSGPALGGEQTEFTDSNGHYLITELPPGPDYVVRFYFSNVKVERPEVQVLANKTLSISIKMPAGKGETQTFRIAERAPNVD